MQGGCIIAIVVAGLLVTSAVVSVIIFVFVFNKVSEEVDDTQQAIKDNVNRFDDNSEIQNWAPFK